MRAPRAAVLALLAAACGGGGATAPTADPNSDPGTPVTGVVFYDENGNGALEDAERVRLPGVGVGIGGRSTRTEAGGRFTLNVPAGNQVALVSEAALPPFFRAGAPVAVVAPRTSGGDLAVPAVLPIGFNEPNVYMAIGDSITFGAGSSDGTGYRQWLADDLGRHWGRARVENEGISATRSDSGAARIAAALREHRPAYTLIMYGTNDWNERECQDERFPCFTVESLRAMVRAARAQQSLPVLSTLIPVASTFAQAADRNDWTRRMNELIRALAREEGIPLADSHAAFLRAPDERLLFASHLHPSDEGYRLIAGAFFTAITGAR